MARNESLPPPRGSSGSVACTTVRGESATVGKESRISAAMIAARSSPQLAMGGERVRSKKPKGLTYGGLGGDGEG